MAHDSQAARRRVANQDKNWMDKGACKGKTDLFFLAGEEDRGVRYDAAKEICFGECPVRQECLDFAIATNQEFGYWGGMTRSERRTYARGKRRAS